MSLVFYEIKNCKHRSFQEQIEAVNKYLDVIESSGKLFDYSIADSQTLSEMVRGLTTDSAGHPEAIDYFVDGVLRLIDKFGIQPYKEKWLDRAIAPITRCWNIFPETLNKLVFSIGNQTQEACLSHYRLPVEALRKAEIYLESIDVVTHLAVNPNLPEVMVRRIWDMGVIDVVTNTGRLDLRRLLAERDIQPLDLSLEVLENPKSPKYLAAEILRNSEKVTHNYRFQILMGEYCDERKASAIYGLEMFEHFFSDKLYEKHPELDPLIVDLNYEIFQAFKGEVESGFYWDYRYVYPPLIERFLKLSESVGIHLNLNNFQSLCTKAYLYL